MQYYRRIVSLVALLLVFSVFIPKAHASEFATIFDRISTSRPSPSSVINGSFASGVSQLTILNNKSRFLASDSAHIIDKSTGALVENQIIASQSSDLTTLYLTANTGNALSSSNAIIVPIVAMHTVQFQTSTSVPSDGKIVITFPGAANNTASPSASTFAFNNLSSSQIAINNASCGSWTIASPSITCNLNSAITPGTTVTVLIGCSAQSGGACTTSSPVLINPTKSAATGTADLWTLNVSTTDNGGAPLDSNKVRIATLDATNVHAQVDPSLTFTIAGIADGTSLSTVDAACSDTTNVGNATTATDVDLGFLSNGNINIAAQKLTVSTNAANGYAITATSSGRFINPSSGYSIKGLNSDTALTGNDTPSPATFGASGTEGFGISPCGSRVNTTRWGSGATAFSSGSKYANPFNSGVNSYYATLASYSGGGAISGDVTVVRYGATISGATPAGAYGNYFTYIATATF